jgi:hypothetical protein
LSYVIDKISCAEMVAAVLPPLALLIAARWRCWRFVFSARCGDDSGLPGLIVSEVDWSISSRALEENKEIARDGGSYFQGHANLLFDGDLFHRGRSNGGARLPVFNADIRDWLRDNLHHRYWRSNSA